MACLWLWLLYFDKHQRYWEDSVSKRQSWSSQMLLTRLLCVLEWLDPRKGWCSQARGHCLRGLSILRVFETSGPFGAIFASWFNFDNIEQLELKVGKNFVEFEMSLSFWLQGESCNELQCELDFAHICEIKFPSKTWWFRRQIKTMTCGTFTWRTFDNRMRKERNMWVTEIAKIYPLCSK